MLKTESTHFINEEPALRNLIIDGAAGGETKRRHDVTFPLLTLHREKDRIHFSTGFSKNKTLSIPASCRFLMHVGASFDKIQPKQVGYFGMN
jgi:hypothetical protein